MPLTNIYNAVLTKQEWVLTFHVLDTNIKRMLANNSPVMKQMTGHVRNDSQNLFTHKIIFY